MKRKYIIFSLIILISSCETMLEEVPKNFVSRANFYETEQDAEAAIAGAYDGLYLDFYGISHVLMVELHGDYLIGAGSQYPVSLVGQVLDQTNIGRCAANWSTLYRAINRANAVLDNVVNISDDEIAPDKRTKILAEAYFLRALAYFELVRGWGPVPLKLEETTNLNDVAAPRMPESEVYAQITEDLTMAENGLGEVGSQTGRASIWAAKMLLAHVYLTTENWSGAAEKALDVIQNGPYSLVRVNEPDDFYQIYAEETSSEDIFSKHNSATRVSDIPAYLHYPNAYPYNYSSAGFTAWRPDTTTFIGAAWDNDDLRKQFNFYRSYMNDNGEWVSLPASTPILFKKYITTTDGLPIINYPIYRFAEALLFYAEASCMEEGAPSAQALEMLNKVKRRAYGYDPDIVSPVDYPSGMGRDEFRELVIQERAYEFILERRRWFDLKRTGKVQEAFIAAGRPIIQERLLWPIAEDEINNNPAINQEDQNPGY